MTASLYVDSELMQISDDVRVSLDFPSADSSAYQCGRCGEDLDETIEGFVDSEGSTRCPDNVYEDEAADLGIHEPRAVPLSWANSAAVVVDEDQDSITVLISVGDPRGAFCFTARRVPEDAGDLSGKLILHMPYPGESFPHRALTELHPGTYVVG